MIGGLLTGAGFVVAVLLLVGLAVSLVARSGASPLWFVVGAGGTIVVLVLALVGVIAAGD